MSLFGSDIRLGCQDVAGEALVLCTLDGRTTEELLILFACERVPLLARHADETVGGVELGDSSGRGEAVPGTDVLTTVATVDVGCEFASGDLGEWAAVLNALVGEAEGRVKGEGRIVLAGVRVVLGRAEGVGWTGVDAAVAIATRVVVVGEGEGTVVSVEW